MFDDIRFHCLNTEIMYRDTSKLNKFISPEYFNPKKEYFLDRVLQTGREEPSIQERHSAESALQNLTIKLQSEFPKLPYNCIHDHVNLLFGNPTEPFFRVTNCWNFRKIEKKFSDFLWDGILSQSQKAADVSLEEKIVRVGTISETTKFPQDIIVYSIEILLDGCRYNTVTAEATKILDCFTLAFRREWPQRHVRIRYVALLTENRFFLEYEDHLAVTNHFSVPLELKTIVYAKTVHFLNEKTTNIITWEGVFIEEFEKDCTVQHYPRQLILRHTTNAYDTVVIEYTKVNTARVTVRNTTQQCLLSVLERVFVARNGYTKIVADDDVWYQLNELTSPSLPEAHNYNFRELKIF